MNTPNLICLNILDTSITDLSNIKFVKLQELGINNDEINLNSIEPYLENISDNSTVHGFRGLYLRDRRAIKTVK